ncbi:cation:proton antiporter [Methanosarcina sp.]|uniref:cation:proton antiporter n=1 Tax=Methanosarcina sp. TaxID=2213 RepID=UPI002C5DEFE5|nr:cation:proton antiporter [Methanosarcina sp.]HOW14870.1 cation:proton antiporter [Methanosarcina sp.]
MQNLDLILTLTGGFVAALVFGYLTHYFKLSPIVGYLLAGIMVSPHTPGFVANTELAEQLAEIGVILLMFGVGLQFHFREFWAVRRIALPGALIQSLATAAFGAIVMHMLGWSWKVGIVFGLAISVASTVVLTRVLSDNNEIHTQTGHIALGWLVMEDLFTVFVLVLLPAIFSPGVVGTIGIIEAFVFTAIKIIVLLVFTFTVGGRLLPRLLTHIASTNSQELFTLAVLAIALGIAVGSAYMFDVSMALGAFLAGMVVGQSEFSTRAATEALPLRDAFAVLFFVSIGMLFDWNSLIESPVLVIATLAIILLGKPLVAFLIVVLMRYPLRVALSVALILSQIGEFSFILATVGADMNILPANAQNILVAAAIISITLNPLLFRAGGKIERWLDRCTPGLTNCIHARCAPAPATNEQANKQSGQTNVIVVGYGIVGQTVVRLLLENDIFPTIVELNVQTVQSLRSQGYRTVYGDAARVNTLIEAGIKNAHALVLSVSNVKGECEIVRQARELNPHISIIARTTYLSNRQNLIAAGADVIFSDEGEVALSVMEMILRQFGATPDQINRERKRVHESFYEGFFSTPPQTKKEEA